MDFIRVFKEAPESSINKSKLSYYMMIRLLSILGFTLFLHGTLSAQAQIYGNEWIDYSKTYYKFPVREYRFFRIPYSTLSANGLAETPVEHFQLWRDGKEEPIYTSVPNGLLPINGYIEFYGRANEGYSDSYLFDNPAFHMQPERSFFLDTAWYFLTVNPTGVNKRYETTENTVNTTTLQPDSFYMRIANGLSATTNINSGKPILIGGNLLRSSNWDEGESFISNRFDFTRTIEYNFTGLKAFMNGPGMSIEYATTGMTNLDREVVLKINNERFDSMPVSRYSSRLKRLDDIPMKGNIVNDAINFKFNSNNENIFDNNVVAKFYFIYPRQFYSNSQAPLAINLSANNQGNHLRISGLPNGNGTYLPVLYDFTNQKRYVGVIKPDTSLFVIEPSATDRFLAVGPQNPSYIRNVTSFKKINFRNFLQPENQGNYLIISHYLLGLGDEDQVAAYRSYRSSSQGGGYNAQIYDIDELAEQFCYGVRKNPLSIRRFILYAVDKFPVKPKMAFLIGSGANYFGYYRATNAAAREILNAIPTWGIPSSDNLLAARINSIPVPEIPIGRLAAISSAEIKIYLDKVKMYESLQRSKPNLPSQNDWRKKILHLIGGDDAYLANSVLSFHMGEYEKIIKQPMPGATVSQFTRPDNPDFASDLREVEKQISEGSGLITYFGHSSTSSIDFNMGSPELYSNSDGKFPVIIANGCRAGNIFDYNPQRLVTRESTISDKFIFAPNNGSISFISNSDLAAINYQNLLTREWYNAIATTRFGKTIGEIQHEALRRAYLRTGSIDKLNMFNIEQSVLHSDPAIVPFMATLPDFAVETSFINTHPSRVLTELDSVDLKVEFFNLGAAVVDEVLLTIERELPDGSTKLIYNQKHKNVFNKDSITITLGIKGLFEEGNGFIITRIDPANDWHEADKDNNVAITPFNLERNHIQPVYPYNFSIINSNAPTLKASTTNPLEVPFAYQFQLDTTALFNSELLIIKDTLSNGGVLAWQPDQSLKAGLVYYWRVTKANVPFSEQSPIFSFQYRPGDKNGFTQEHFFQHKQSIGKQIEMDESRQWTYMPKEHNIYVAHGIYSTSGTEETHFSITVNGEMLMRSACIGSSIIFNLFDSLTFEPVRNAPFGAYGSADSCLPGREYNFEFRYFNHTNRKKIMDFLEIIPKGTYVAARLVADRPYDSLLARHWKNDTLIYGKDNSLYHSLVKHGFYDLDSLNTARTFFFMFRKGDSSSFKPYSKFSRGVIERIHTSVYPTVTDKGGLLTSPWIGPSKTWKEAEWNIEKKPSLISGSPEINLQLWGRKSTGHIEMLKEWSTWNQTVPIGDIDADEYPHLQFRLLASGDYGMSTPQLRNWTFYYDPLPDGAWSGNDLFYLKKSNLAPLTDTLSLKLAFKNVSETMLDSTHVNVYIAELNGTPSLFHSTRFKTLQPNDTAILNIEKVFSMPEGNYQLLIEANESGKPKEQNYFNNRALIPIMVSGGPLSADPFRFDAIKAGRKVELKWEALENEKVDAYGIEHSTTGEVFKTIAQKVKHSGRRNELLQFSTLHDQPANGYNYYRVVIIHKDGSVKFSETRKIYFESENHVKAAPNPFNQYFILQPLDNTREWQLKIMDINGKLIRAEKGSGGTRIDMDNASDGIYLLHWSSGDKTQIIKILKQ
jgi:hypothetical protein